MMERVICARSYDIEPRTSGSRDVEAASVVEDHASSGVDDADSRYGEGTSSTDSGRAVPRVLCKSASRAMTPPTVTANRKKQIKIL